MCQVLLLRRLYLGKQDVKNCLALLIIVLLGVSASAVEMVTLPIGNVNNPPDTRGATSDGTCCYGAVPYKYRIGLYEVTNDQYTEFLNAVAATDENDLYDPMMGMHHRGGILQSGTSGNYTYSVKPKFSGKPANWIRVWDAMRFMNWLHNGQPTGPQNASTTEDGAYTLNGVIRFSFTETDHPTNDGIVRNEGARWFLPNEDEWYKAAYYDPRTEAEGGPPGDQHYWDYATQSTVVPIGANTDADGHVINPGPNVANYNYSASWNAAIGSVSTVGSAGLASRSFFETFDQAGNVWEWTDSIVDRLRDGENRMYRGVRGGCWDDVPAMLAARRRPFGGDGAGGCHGLRVATHFSPDDLDGNGQVDVADIDLLTETVNSRTRNTALDLNDDGVLSASDRVVWVEDLVNTYFGDSNFDGQFDSGDLIHVLEVGEYEDELALNSSWNSGDWDGDKDFAASDFIYVFERGGYNAGPRERGEVVPEPSSGLIMLLGVFLAVEFRAQRRHVRRVPVRTNRS